MNDFFIDFIFFPRYQQSDVVWTSIWTLAERNLTVSLHASMKDIGRLKKIFRR
ncbi:hypothetical protein LMG29542_01464 [Paraburkholderia humisilvae]|uniref:Uncharacterized protein n=1 Tax=Paraburkholderia humisilvae TaxID=627669 RepID=A0A6J5DDF1_9BURK|nr:hypothetical protein LMG29542_01464 [Paraburkholderia humisilvae]